MQAPRVVLVVLSITQEEASLTFRDTAPHPRAIVPERLPCVQSLGFSGQSRFVLCLLRILRSTGGLQSYASNPYCVIYALMENHGSKTHHSSRSSIWAWWWWWWW